MLFLVEMDRVKSGITPTPESGRVFIEQIIFPTLARAEQLVAEKKILAGGPTVGRVALRFIIEAASLPEADRMISSLPLWRVAETSVIPLEDFADRRTTLQGLLDSLAG